MQKGRILGWILLMWVAAFQWAFTQTEPVPQSDGGPPNLGELLSFGKILWSLLVIILGWLTLRSVSRFLEFVSERRAKSRVVIKRFIPVILLTGWALITYIVIAGIIQPPSETMIAVGASLGIAIGFSSQDILKNMFAGLVILIDRPFQVGDMIQIGSFYGEVKQIGLRSTRVETKDDSLVTVPNGELMNQSVSNSSFGKENCMVVSEIYLPITVNTQEVRQIATEAAQVSKYIYLNKPIIVRFFNEVKEQRSYFKMRLKAYVMDTRYEFDFQSEMTELVIKALLEKGIIQAEELF